MVKTTMGRTSRPYEEVAARCPSMRDEAATGPERNDDAGRTLNGSPASGVHELFQAAELERMGLLPASSAAHVGTLFVGDGLHASGWYHAWAGDGFTVVTCDFTILVDMFSASTRNATSPCEDRRLLQEPALNTLQRRITPLPSPISKRGRVG